MPHISKFLFETDFAEPESARPKSRAEDDDEIETPSFSEAELLSAREHGYEAGIAAAQAQALASVEKHVSELIASINNQLDTVSEEFASQQTLAAKDVAALASAIAAKVTGTKSDESRLDLLERMITDCMAKLYQAPEVVPRVPADLEAELKSRLSMSNMPITVSVVPDQALNGTDCYIAWHGGGAERVEAHIWQEIETLLERYVAGEATTDAPDDTASATEHVAQDTAGAAEATFAAEPKALADDTAESTDPASHVGDAPTQSTPTLEQHGGQPERPAPGDQDG